MPQDKPNYTERVHQVVRESAEPLPFDDIFRRVDAILPVTTKNPKSTIRNAISQSRLIVNIGDGRYGWVYRVINGSVLRPPLSKNDLQRRQLSFPEEVRDALWPTFFENQKRADHSPARVQLPNGAMVEWTLELLVGSRWGTKAAPRFLEWFTSLDMRPGDALLVRVVDGEARLYAVEFQPHAARDEQAIRERNDAIRQIIFAYFKRAIRGVMISDLSRHSLATGQYKHTVPPDPLEQIWTREVWQVEMGKSQIDGWFPIEREDVDLLIQRYSARVSKRSKEQTEGAPAAKQKSNAIYQLQVTLKYSKPAIWRRIQVPADMTLAKLHRVLQIVMGWTDSHLHHFRIAGHYYGIPDPDFDDWSETLDERRVRLNQLVLVEHARFLYEYDFGDSWEHEIVVEKILDPEAGVRYPICLAGKHACPPEDVGGIGGYYAFLEAINDSRHPEHAEMLEWIGGEFDPEAFDMESINQRLKRLK